MSKKGEQVSSRSEHLPKAFVGLSFVNFFVGAGLGGWMAANTGVWSVVGRIHGEINPFGWLTMLIYGMTYMVLSTFVGIHPPRTWVGWLHLFLSETAVVLIVAAYLGQNIQLYQVGLGLQFFAPLIFLVNILSAVYVSRRHKARIHDQEYDQARQTSTLVLLGSGSTMHATDRVAQRGTDLSLLLFIIAVGWMFFTGVHQSEWSEEPTTALFLVYYGWIAGTVTSVALHLLPRLFGKTRIRARAAEVGQALWLVAVVSSGLGFWLPQWANLGPRVMGIALSWFSILYLYDLIHSKVAASNPVHDPVQGLSIPSISWYAWFSSWVFLLMLGIALGFGLNPLSLVAMHLLFLGFATTLVYGVGYALFPFLLGRKIPSLLLAKLQLASSLLGVLLMTTAFLGLQYRNVYLAHTGSLLAVGGTLAMVGAMVFLLQWFFK